MIKEEAVGMIGFSIYIRSPGGTETMRLYKIVKPNQVMYNISGSPTYIGDKAGYFSCGAVCSKYVYVSPVFCLY
jgi:hypothetical protein